MVTSLDSVPSLPAEHAGLIGSLLHDQISRLPYAVASFHASVNDVRGLGTFDVRQARRWYGRLVARVLRLPRASGATPVTLTIRRQHTAHSGIVECWSRQFDGEALESTQTVSAQYLVERIGGLELRFAVSVLNGRLHFDQVSTSVRLGARGVRLPGWAAPRITASVGANDQQLDVSVRIDAPVLGTLLSYGGLLTPERPR